MDLIPARFRIFRHHIMPTISCKEIDHWPRAGVDISRVPDRLRASGHGMKKGAKEVMHAMNHVPKYASPNTA